jgi:hypothetical protein
MNQMLALMKQSLEVLGRLSQIRTTWVNGVADTLDYPAFGNLDSIANTTSNKD